MQEFTLSLLSSLEVTQNLKIILSKLIIAFTLVLASFMTWFIIHAVILKTVRRITLASRNKIDDILMTSGLLHRLSLLVPVLCLYAGIDLVFPGMDSIVFAVRRILLGIIIVISMVSIHAFLTGIEQFYNTLTIAKRTPIRGYIQLIKVFLLVVGIVFVISTLLGKSPWGIVSGIGAMTAIILLVFKDSILGFVASIQLNANNMVEIGDWIEMPKYTADGDVMEINLNTIKVQNWDKTISTIPTYALISDSFKNWRGMQQSGGRRIKRCLNIDMASIAFCTPEMIQNFRKVGILTDYIDNKIREIDEDNKHGSFDKGIILNGRSLTNIGTFRAYVESYLKNHSAIHQDMTLLVRQRQPGPHGLPIEIYAFCNDTRWTFYEGIQSDIFDHILAVVPQFGLRVFQTPSGADIALLHNGTP